MSDPLIAQFESLIRRDPARRGLIGTEPQYGPLCAGHLAEAAAHLANFGTHVAIATGFFIPHGDVPAAETDGPPGALLLATALQRAGIECTIVTDTLCLPAVQAVGRAMDFPNSAIWECQRDDPNVCSDFFLRGPGHALSHLIAIERVGPSHTHESLATQRRLTPTPLARFTENVSPDHFNHCHNMRGQIIDPYTANVHQLFEEFGRHRPDGKTIGIGDGGNEIGMGSIPWEELERRLPGEHAGTIPCRVATDWTIIAGTSNWGAYALAAATLLLRGDVELLKPFDREQQLRVLMTAVKQGPAVDGITLRREATVDGLPFLTYIQPWVGIRRLLGWDE